MSTRREPFRPWREVRGHVPSAHHVVYEANDGDAWIKWWREEAPQVPHEETQLCPGLAGAMEALACGEAPRTHAEREAWLAKRTGLEVTASVVAATLPAGHVARARKYGGSGGARADEAMTWGSSRETAGLALVRRAIERERGRPLHGWVRPGLVTRAGVDGCGATPDWFMCVGSDEGGCELVAGELKCPFSRVWSAEEPLPPSIWVQPAFGAALSGVDGIVCAQVFRDGRLVLSWPDSVDEVRQLGSDAVAAARAEVQRKRAPSVAWVKERGRAWIEGLQ